jgi:uncharacterized protein (TIGR02452 family)
MDSQNPYDMLTSSSELSSAATADSTNDAFKYSSSSLEKNPISEEMLKQQDESPLEWECEVCTYTNKSTSNLCSICGQGQRPYALTQMVPNKTFTQSDSSKSELNLYPILSEENSATETDIKVSPVEDKVSTLSIITSSSELSSAYITDSANESFKYSSSSLEKNPISEQMLKQQDQSPVEWECEVCTYANESTRNRCGMCKEGQRPYALPEIVANKTFSQSAQSDSPKSELNLHPILSEKKSRTETDITVSPVENKRSKSSIITAISEQEFVVFIPDLPFDKSNIELEQMIRSRLSNDYHVHVMNFICYPNIGVGIVDLANENDKNYLVKSLRSTLLDSQTNTIIQFVEELEFISYLVLDQNIKTVITSDEVARRWQELCKSSQLPICEVIAVQFPNIFKIVSRSLDELLAIQNINLFTIKNQFTKIYLNANCSFFEDLPQNITSSQIVVAINAQIGGQFDQSSLYVQYNKDASNAIVLTTNAARQWTNINFISLNNQDCMKKTRLAFRLVLHSLPREISTNIVTNHELFQNAIIHNARIDNKLIIEVNDKSVYDTCISIGAIRIKDHLLSIEPFTTIINHPENREINDETWYETQMLDYQPDLKQFLDNPEHPIFKYKWNSQNWLEKFKRYKGIRNDENDKQRRLLRVTVMLNTIGVLWKKCYTIKMNNNEKEIKLNLEQMKNIIYNHQSKLVNKKEIFTSLTPPFSSTIVKVVNEDCLVVYQRLASEKNHPVLLNMANAETPGGAYRKGAGAQEENLFRRSNYYLSLDMELDHNKQADRFCCTSTSEQKFIKNDQKIYPIEEYGAIYTSGITVFRDTEDNGYDYLEEPVYDVCSIALPAYARPELKRNNNNTLAKKYAVGTRKKIENFFAIAHHHGHDCLILSALGCGAFRNPPIHIAMIFKSVIQQYAGYFKKIYFSIIDDYNTGNRHNPDGNYQPFKTILDDIIVQPSKHELDVNMMSGPYRILSKNQGKIIIDHVKIFDLPLCNYSSLCRDLNDTQHCQSYYHPPICPQYDSCDQNSKDEVHLSSFIHRTQCLHGGICKLTEDEKHLRLYHHPEFCSDHGFCINMNTNHLIKYLHVNLCKDNLKCISYLKNDPDHCFSYRHCQPNCSFGGYCIHFHDKEHINNQVHPFRTPCPLTPFACKYHMEYLQAKKDHSSKIRREIEEHCIVFSHVCPFGRQCREKTELHIQTSIHIARNLCSNLNHCSQLTDEEHLNSFTHSNIRDIRLVCKYSKSDCHERRNREHILNYRHIGNSNHIGIARYSGLNKNINFIHNQNQLLKTLVNYTETQKWKQPKDNIEEITEWIRSLQPIHRCNQFIFESILIHGHVMSRKYMDRLRNAQFVVNAVDQHPKVRKIFKQHNNTVLQSYARDFIQALVAIEFNKNISSNGLPVRSTSDVAAVSYPSSVNNEQFDIIRMRESQMKISLKQDEINTIRNHAIRIAEASLKLHTNPMGIGHGPDEVFGTNDHVFSVLGPHLGSYYGDIFIVFKHEIMFHPDSNFSIQAATSYGQGGNTYQQRPWLTDPGTLKDRVQYFHSTKLHCSIPGYDHVAAMELIALTGLKKKTMNVKLKDIQERWMNIDSHEVFESHLPHLIPLDYIDHIYMPKNVFYSLSPYAQNSTKEIFHDNLTITDHIVNSNITQQLDTTRRSYEKYVHDEIKKKIANNNYRFRYGTIITLPASNLTQYICIPITISQSFYQYQTTNHQSDNIFIYWQAIGGDMMLTISEHQIDSSRDQSNNPCLMCYISDISLNNNNNDYRESYSYITNNHPYSHDMLVQNSNFKAKSNRFHCGCNIYDYITYCLKIKAKTGEVTLTHVGANSIYNHQIINYIFQRSELDLTKLDYIQVSACNRIVPIRNLVIRHEPIKEYYPSFDKDFKDVSEPLISSSKHTTTASVVSQDDQEQSLSNYRKDKLLVKDNKSLIPCRDSVNCLLQYSSDNSESHNKKYSHPCRYSELCRSIGDHPHLEHIPHLVSLCQYDKNCRQLIDPIHRAQYRHSNLPDFLLPCRYQKNCRDKTNEHRIKYSHGEKISLSSTTGISNNIQYLSLEKFFFSHIKKSRTNII